MADVFISYVREDEPVARRVAKALQASGLDVWWDANLPAHRAYSEEIERNLEAARAVVVLWSKPTAKSQWVRAEADFARNAGKLVQASLDGTLPPMPFNQIQCADLKGWRGSTNHAGWAKLSNSVQALVSGEERPVERIGPPSAWDRFHPHRWWAAAALALLVVAAGLFLLLGRPADDGKPVLAVLPFKSLDARDASLVAGIWEDTRQALSRNPQLLVLGPHTSEELAKNGGNAAVRAADYLVEANVRSMGDRVRVSANLVRSKDRAQVWSDTFERRLDDVFQLQQEMAGEIEGRIRGRLAERGGVLPEHIATSGEVYALYSDARAKVRKRQFPRYKEAAQQLHQVVRRDPNFAPGWATLAVMKQFGILGEERSRRSAESDARRAIALAPNLAAGHAALGFVLNKGPAAQASLRRALQLDPNDIEAMNWLANSLDDSQRDEKLRLYSEVVKREPLWWPAVMNKLNHLMEGGNMLEAEQELARLEKLGDAKLATAVRITIATRKGDLSAAAATGLDYYRRAPPQDREFIGQFFFVTLYQLGLFDIGDRLFAPPNAYIPYVRTNDPRAIPLIEAEHSPAEFWTYGYLAIVGARIYLLNNQGPRLARLYRAVASSPEEFEAHVGKVRFPDIAPGAALALRSAGDEAQARRLLDLAAARAGTMGDLPDLERQVRIARIYAVQGRTGEAIQLLSLAIRRGWIPPYLPIHTDIALDPPLAQLRKDPRFEPLRQQILGHIKKERAELGPVTLN